MRKALYSAFCCVLLFGGGCHISNYGIITDNNQSNGSGGGIVNTTGKAHIKESSQVASIWPDGSDEMINFVDQMSDGTATLTYQSTPGFLGSAERRFLRLRAELLP